MKKISTNISIKKINDTYIVRFPQLNKLNILNSNEIETELIKLTEQSNRRIVLDLQEITFIDSTGFGMLVNLKRKTSFKYIDLFLLYVNEEVQELFSLLGLENEFNLNLTSLKKAS